MSVPRIVAIGGYSTKAGNQRLHKWLLSLARSKRPKVLFLPTASGDSKEYIGKFYRAFRPYDCTASHLELFNRSAGNPRDVILASDLVYVGGGNTANLLAVWRVHGVDQAMREAWERGVVLAGASAGAICWFEAGVTDSFAPKLQALRDGLAFLKGSFCPHYDSEKDRRPVFRRLVARREVAPGLAADDGVAIVFHEKAVAYIVVSRRGAGAYRVTRWRGGVRESSLETRLLP